MDDLGDVIGKPPAPVEFHEFGDADGLRSSIFDKTMKAMSTSYPIENTKHRLEVRDLKWEGPERYSLKDQKKAVMQGDTLEHKLTGTWALVDKATGQTVDKKKTTIAHLPWATDRGTFVYRGNEYVVCLHGSSKVWTECGMIEIRDIVKTKRKIRVWSWDITKREFVLKPVVGWYKNPSNDNIGCSHFEGYARTSGSFPLFTPKTLWATHNHMVFDLHGNKLSISEARELAVVEEQLSNTQKQLLYGTMLGDGHIRSDGVYSVIHGAPQREYAAFKREILASVTGMKLRMVRRKDQGKWAVSYRFYTRAHAAFHAAHKLMYIGRRKVVSQAWLNQINEAGLAFWFGDDGSSQRTRNTNHAVIQLHTQCFSAVEIALLREWLNKRWGFNTYTVKAKKYVDRDCGWVICMSGDTANRFLDLIAPYLHKNLHYKLLPRPTTKYCSCGMEIKPTRDFCNKCVLLRENPDHRISKTARYRFGSSSTVRDLLANINQLRFYNEDGCARWNDRLSTAGSAIDAMCKDTNLVFSLVSIPAKYEQNTGKHYEKVPFVYDIQVEDTHNYVANGVLVSNCNQTRLRPGVYARVKDNGILEAHVNAKIGTGPSFRVYMEPDTGIFRLAVGQSTLKLYPLLREMGVSDKQIEQSWGNDLLRKNVEADDPRAVQRAFHKLVTEREEPPKED